MTLVYFHDNGIKGSYGFSEQPVATVEEAKKFMKELKDITIYKFFFVDRV